MSHMKARKTLFTRLAYFIVVFVLHACVAGMQLLPKSADPGELKGTYALILYGGRHPADLETMAVLVDENSPYLVEVYALESMYKVTKGLSASQALNAGNAFLNQGSYTVRHTVLRGISDNTGRTIGYELKPLYRPGEVRTPETTLSSYILKDGKVTVYITLDPVLERGMAADDDTIGDTSGP